LNTVARNPFSGVHAEKIEKSWLPANQNCVRLQFLNLFDRRKRMMRILAAGFLVLGVTFIGVSEAQPPPTINIQGGLADSGGGPVTGTHAFRIRFFTVAVGGTEIGAANGNATFSDGGRYSIAVTPPAAVLSANEVYYELAIDTADDGLDQSDTFPNRVQIHSVPFALLAANANLLGGSPASGFLTASAGSGQFLSKNMSDTFSGSKLTVNGALDVGTAGTSSHDVNIFGASPGARLYWNESRNALRAGRVTGAQWDSGNVGRDSVAMGFNTTASGVTSTAMGFITTASGTNSTALGTGTVASGIRSTAMGFGTIAGGVTSSAMGYGTAASGGYSTAMGYDTAASGTCSTAMGLRTAASGYASTAMGRQTIATGPDSTAMGYSTTASGYGAIAMGGLTIAAGTSSLAMGVGTTASGSVATAMGVGIEAAGDNSLAIALDNQSGTVVSQNNTMAIVGGRVGIGSVTPTTRLLVEDNVSGFVATFVNKGDISNRDGILVQAGTNDGSFTTDFLLAIDGDGDHVGALRNSSGTFSVVDLSDRKSKTDIRDTEVDALAIVDGLRVVDFKRKSNPNGPMLHGFIAQEAQEVFPEMVTQLDEDMLGISKDALIPILTKAIQEQQKEIERLRALVETK
jgi:hypothetical protein